MKTYFSRGTRIESGFTLVELMVSTALIALLMLMLLQTVDQTQNIWKRTTAKIAQFQASRAAFESMNRRLSQATLNTYYRATDTASGDSKANFLFRRQSELHFVSGHLANATTDSGTVPGIFTASPTLPGLYQPTARAYPTHGVFFFAPLGITEEGGAKGTDFEATRRFRGLDAMLTACGYFIEYGDDPWRPKVLPLATETDPGVPPRLRFRLMELSVPAEELLIFKRLPTVNGNNNDPTKTVPGEPWEWKWSVTPQNLDSKSNHYEGITKTDIRTGKITTNATWIRPFWMLNEKSEKYETSALKRTTLGANNINRFTYGRVMADNVIALVVLPKLAEKDRPSPTKIGSLAPDYQFDSWRVIDTDKGSNIGLANCVRDNKLPPIIQVVMVAIDETSALRLPRNVVPDWTIRDKQLFTHVDDEDDLLRDLAELEKRLQHDKINYRVFSSDIVLRSSKWSKDPGQVIK